MNDPSAVIFEDGEVTFGIEEERLLRQKHAPKRFPERSIRACLDHCEVTLSDVDEILLPYDPELIGNLILNNAKKAFLDPEFFGWRLVGEAERSSRSFLSNVASVIGAMGTYTGARSGLLTELVRRRLEDLFGGPVPPIVELKHHACHAASAYYPADFDEGLILTMDARGEHDSTVVWRGENGTLTRERTYADPNSLGFFFAAVTEFLGYRAHNGEGKIMGLAPYGERNEQIEDTLTGVVSGGVDYDVTGLTSGVLDDDVDRLERLFGRPRKRSTESFTDWEKDLACVAQHFLEATVTDIVAAYCDALDTGNVGLAGGVALNCKLNKRIMEHDDVQNLFVQPLAHDGGLAFGAGLLEYRTEPEMTNVYYGPAYSPSAIRRELETNKVSYRRPDDIVGIVAKRLAEGELVGWFQGRLEMGPRALGDRSILADPRTIESRTSVNEHVKHREEWRPFAPSLLEEAVDTYLVNPESAPYMIRSFDTTQAAKDEIPATLHPADDTTRPQTVSRQQNPRYYDLISEFEAITGVPVLLNTSFNDNGEPIVNTPKEALKDFYGMGLDVLAIGDFLVEK